MKRTTLEEEREGKSQKDKLIISKYGSQKDDRKITWRRKRWKKAERQSL